MKPLDDLKTLKRKTIGNVENIHFLFDGPEGEIEALLDVPANATNNDTICVICHPHPLFGGSMTNKVVHYIAKSLNEPGVITLRFNFRGVGQSQGTHDNAIGERNDLLSAIDVIHTIYPSKSLWLAGFSFGAYIAFSMSHFANAQRLITVAPAVHLCDFSEVELPDCPWLLIQGDQDEIVPPDMTIHWAKNLPRPPDMEIIHNAGHFFHGHLNDLKQVILNHL